MTRTTISQWAARALIAAPLIVAGHAAVGVIDTAEASNCYRCLLDPGIGYFCFAGDYTGTNGCRDSGDGSWCTMNYGWCS